MLVDEPGIFQPPLHQLADPFRAEPFSVAAAPFHSRRISSSRTTGTSRGASIPSLTLPWPTETTVTVMSSSMMI
jgi:hypothetical protein